MNFKTGPTRNRCHTVNFSKFLGGRLQIYINSSYQIRPFFDASVEASRMRWRGPEFIKVVGHIREQDVKHLADALKNCTQLRRLELRNANIGNPAAESIAPSLPFCAALVHLDLGYNSIGNVGIIALARVLPTCNSIQTLNLESNLIDNSSILRLSSALRQCPSLLGLNIAGNAVGGRAVSRLRSAVPSLAVLS
jgi:Ran GTPase-activating protein (RanGAP) involved in mRNA processing and transport